jgi:hypothetical protein
MRPTEQALPRKVIDAYAESCYLQYSTAFYESPTADNWVSLTRAMLVYQQVRNCRDVDKERAMIDAISALPISKWDEAIVKALQGKSIAEVMRS